MVFTTSENQYFQTERNFILGREIAFSPEGILIPFAEEISDRPINESKGVLASYHHITEYDGSMVDKVVYRLSKTNTLIADEHFTLMEAIANPDTELDPQEFKASAYVLRGIICIDDKEKPIKLI